MNLTDVATFATDLIKCADTRVNKKNKILWDTKQHMHEIAVNSDWNTQILQILREKRDWNFLLKGKFLSKLPKPVKVTHKWINKKFKYQEP